MSTLGIRQTSLAGKLHQSVSVQRDFTRAALHTRRHWLVRRTNLQLVKVRSVVLALVALRWKMQNNSAWSNQWQHA
jgi:glycerol-3-phosphate dehydrogenase